MSEWKSIKVKKTVYDASKRIGGGSISKALELIVKTQQKRIEEKLNEINSIAGELVELLVKYGFFSVKITGVNVDDVTVNGEDLIIRGSITVHVPDSELRNKIYCLVRGGVVGKTEQN